MAWFKRYYGTTNYARDQEHFARLFVELGGPKGMMMVHTGRATKCTVYISLSPILAARNFPEFEPSAAPPPDDFTALLGHDDEFAAMRRASVTPSPRRKS
jgi:hypothetical protein